MRQKKNAKKKGIILVLGTARMQSFIKSPNISQSPKSPRMRQLDALKIQTNSSLPHNSLAMFTVLHF